jgi:hypothetical protein
MLSDCTVYKRTPWRKRLGGRILPKNKSEWKTIEAISLLANEPWEKFYFLLFYLILFNCIQVN